MCSFSRFVVFIALLSASAALRADDASNPPSTTPAAQNPAETQQAPATVVASPPVVAPATPATTVVVPAQPTDTLSTSIEPRPEYGQFAGAINFPPSIELANVSDIITHAAIGRGWRVLSHTNGKIIITNQKGKWNCQLSLLWTPTQIVIYSNSTRGDKPAVPKSWVDNLTGDITQAISPGFRASEKKKSK